jgi:hypothetical protein
MSRHFFTKTLMGVGLYILSQGGVHAANPVYVYGVASCLGDTVVYVTTLQSPEEATIDTKTSFLAQRSQYSQQLERYLRDREGRAYTAATIFAKTRRKAEKSLLALRRRLSREASSKLIEISSDDFHFAAPQAAE